MTKAKVSVAAFLSGVALVAGSATHAKTITVSVENVLPQGGFSLTPFYVAFHDGSFDAFSSGSPATPGVETLAELGDVSGLPPERLAVDPNSTAAVVAQPQNGPPTIDPGEIGTVELTLDPTGGNQRFFSFLSMIVPTNDTFVGNGNPLAFEIFDLAGNFMGDRVIDVTAAFSYDAGTEVNDPANGPAFVLGVDATAGAEQNGVITQGLFGLDAFLGLDTPAGLITEPLNILTDLGDTRIARITISDVADPAPVPLPAAAWLLVGGMLTLAGVGRLRRSPG